MTTAVSAPAATETPFDQWLSAMCQRVGIAATLPVYQQLAELPRTVWDAVAMQDAMTSRGDDEGARKCAALVEVLWGDNTMQHRRAALDTCADYFSRQQVMAQPPNLAALCSRLDRLVEAMRAPVKIIRDSAGRPQGTQRQPAPGPLRNVAQRVDFGSGSVNGHRILFQMLAPHKIAVPALIDGGKCAIVANFDDGSLWRRDLPDATAAGGAPLRVVE